MSRAKNNSSDGVAHLAERLQRLSTKRQEIIRPILEQPRDFVLLSVRALAQRLQTDPATIVRIVRGLGFASYREFQHHLHELSLAFATSQDTMPASDDDQADLPAQIRDAITQDVRNLQSLKNSIDLRRLLALAERLYAARRVVIVASDLASVLAEYFDYQLSLLGLPVFSAISAGRIFHLSRSVNRRDVVLGITFRRGLRQTVLGIRQAKARGAYCVGIADTFLSPLGRECDEIFLASVESNSFGASYVAPISLINAILAACGRVRRAQTLAIVREIAEEQRKGFRWYGDQ